MTGNLSTDILVIYLPAALAVLMGILGILRGTKREVVVSGAIVLATLITLVWGAPWATDIHDMLTNFSAGDIRNVLVYVVMVLAVLVIGYLLGSALVPRTRISPLSRLGGLVIGILNGLAIGGYFIRSNDESAQLDPTGSNVEMINTIHTNTIALSLYIWSNWFPLAVAIVAAIVAIVGPFRRAQATVATPAADTNWGPSTAPSVGTRAATVAPAAPITSPGPAAYTTGYGQGFTNQYPQPPNQQYGQQSAQPYQQYGQAPQPAPPAFGGAGYPPVTPLPTAPARVQDAPPTMPMPASDLPHSTPEGGQGTHYFGTSGPASPSSPASSTPAVSSDWATYGSEPSWLTAPSQTPSLAQLPTESLPTRQPNSDNPAPPVDNSLVARSEAPTQSQSVIDASTPIVPVVTPSATEDKLATSDSTTPTTKASGPSTGPLSCPRCGAAVPADAAFCTECGYRLRS
jgi:Colicin V production protein/zinc-ribbon domain